mmetsp:Transcript_24725/g.80854  ORF Transcript_24725/g.80854 Transcript_24725/m.80854 type:complete len:254 (-) Transcript_24725:610-1371(-)
MLHRRGGCAPVRAVLRGPVLVGMQGNMRFVVRGGDAGRTVLLRALLQGPARGARRAGRRVGRHQERAHHAHRGEPAGGDRQLPEHCGDLPDGGAAREQQGAVPGVDQGGEGRLQPRHGRVWGPEVDSGDGRVVGGRVGDDPRVRGRQPRLQPGRGPRVSAQVLRRRGVAGIRGGLRGVLGAAVHGERGGARRQRRGRHAPLEQLSVGLDGRQGRAHQPGEGRRRGGHRPERVGRPERVAAHHVGSRNLELGAL